MNIFKRFRYKLSNDTLHAVELLLKQKNITWEQLPWQIQFLPSVIKYIHVVGDMNTINPDISGLSGMVGASKAHLNTKVNPIFRPKDALFHSGVTVEQMQRRIIEKKILFPIFIKPVKGERAAGVEFLRDKEALSHVIIDRKRSYIIEEAIMTHAEFCINVQRNLESNMFSVFSITERIIPKVTGDGLSSIRQLIPGLDLTDLQKQKIENALDSSFLNKVLERNISENVVRTASISYGTEYVKLNLNPNQKKLLEHQINQMLLPADGFNIGRFDIKANNLQALLVGDCKVVELNGIGGMPTHVYETHLSIEQKQNILDEYFELLQIFSRQQVSRGFKSIGFWTAFKQITRAARTQDRSTELKRLEKAYLWAVVKNVVRVWFMK
jgi:hypothetical protein